MDEDQDTTWAAALREVPDPRKRRGVRHPWSLRLIRIGAALVRGQRHGRAIAQWVREPAETLHAALGPQPTRLPNEATLRRTLRTVDVRVVEARLGRYAAAREQEATSAHAGLLGQARDGKQVQGASAHGAPCPLVSLMRHTSTLVLGQTQAEEQSNEMTAAPHRHDDRDLRGTVTTVAALWPSGTWRRGFWTGSGTPSWSSRTISRKPAPPSLVVRYAPVAGRRQGCRILDLPELRAGAWPAGDQNAGGQHGPERVAQLARGRPRPAPHLRARDHHHRGGGAGDHVCGDQPDPRAGQCRPSATLLARALGDREPAVLRAGCDHGRGCRADAPRQCTAGAGRVA
ncbi:MAG: transposase family protein [Chloroflexi bacterium]|nr:transposase family protein [Chloroflexota bacterium]